MKRQSAILLTILLCSLISGAFTTRIISQETTEATEEIPLEETSERETKLKPELVPENEPELESSLPQLYHTPEVLALNYKEMRESLKVFVYPNSLNSSYEYSVSTDPPNEETFEETGAAEGKFFKLLVKKQTSFVTKDPEEAHLFFLPLNFDALVRKLGREGVGHHLRHYLQDIRENFTFWDRSLGSDHFYLATAGYEPFNHRNTLEFTKNAIQVARSPLLEGQFLYPHKDISLPSYQKRTEIQGGGVQERSHLANVGLRTLFPPTEWTTDPAFLFDSTNLEESKFCITDSMHNVVDALRAGCVPVLVSDTLFYDLPFPDILNWHAFAVVMGASEVESLKEVLGSMSKEKYKRMQYLGLQASLHMQWNDPAVAYDAFHMTLFELWMRRHSVKYGRRSDL